MKTLTKIIHGVLIYFIVFVAVAWITFWVKGSVPDTLIQFGLGGGAIELIVGGFIEVGKKYIEKKYHLNEYEGEMNYDDGTDVSESVDSVGNSKYANDAGNEEVHG